VKIGDRDVDPNLKELRNETITVLEIGHYREPCKDGGSMILHDFVGFRVRFENVIFLIKAEKSKTGITVTRPVRWCKDVSTVVPRYVCENLEACGEILVEDLLAILEEPSPDYHLLRDNCWSYADAIFKQVIRKFSETPSLSPERRSYLASFLNNAPPVMPDEVLRSIKFAAVKAAVLEIPLGIIIIIGIVGATAVAAVVAPTTLIAQVATFYIALRCAGFPTTQAYVPQVCRVMPAYRGAIPGIQRVLAPLITRGWPAYWGAISAPPAVPAPLITRAFQWAAWVAPYLLIVAAGVVIGFIVYALVKLFIFGRHATSLEHSFQRWWRSLFPRRPLNQAQGLPPL
jgi:hypothetical protein